MAINDRQMDRHESRVLAILTRQPGMTVGEVAASLSGILMHDARKAMQRLEASGQVTRLGANRSNWYPVGEFKTENLPTPPQSLSERPPYIPAYEAPARVDALAHTLIGSRRGDDMVPFGPPRGMESVPVKTFVPIPANPKMRSPINSASFGKRTPVPIVERASA